MSTNGVKESRERRFRDIEHVFAAYVRVWPGALHVKAPEGLEATTFSNRVRKIAGEYRHDRWPASFTPERFDEVWEETTVGVTSDGLVEIKRRGKAQVQAAQVKLPGQAMLTVKELGKNPRRTLMRLVRLHHEGIIDGGATHIQGLPEDVALELKAMLDAQPLGNRRYAVDFRRHGSEPGWLLY